MLFFGPANATVSTFQFLHGHFSPACRNSIKTSYLFHSSSLFTAEFYPGGFTGLFPLMRAGKSLFSHLWPLSRCHSANQITRHL